MSSINLSRDTESADYLNAIRKELAQSKAKNTNATALLEYILDFYNKDDLKNSFGSPSYYSNPFEVNKRLR